MEDEFATWILQYFTNNKKFQSKTILKKLLLIFKIAILHGVCLENKRRSWMSVVSINTNKIILVQYDFLLNCVKMYRTFHLL